MKAVCFLKKIFETDDLDFYDEFFKDKSDEILKSFWDENPEFLEDYPISKEHRYLLRDKMYLGILRDIKNYKASRCNSY
jgi:hypothetical protein